MLGIDAKIFRKWLQQAHVPFSVHPKDARIKCLTMPQVQQLARLHGRPLPLPVSAPSVLDQALGQAQPSQESEARLAEETDLRKKLSCLEANMSTRQEQLAQLALALLRERELRYEQRLSALEGLVQQTLQPVPSSPEFQETLRPQEQETKPRPERCPHPAEQRTRPLLPLIEYGAHGQYMVICP